MHLSNWLLIISYKNQLMHTCILNTTLLALCYPDMFQPLNCHPHGFRKGLSTDNATYKLTETIFHTWNNGKCVACVFCDMIRELDCVNHELLVKKLEFYGGRGFLLNWFTSI
jgi:hypothetical protein